MSFFPFLLSVHLAALSKVNVCKHQVFNKIRKFLPMFIFFTNNCSHNTLISITIMVLKIKLMLAGINFRTNFSGANFPSSIILTASLMGMEFECALLVHCWCIAGALLVLIYGECMKLK